MAVTYKNPGVIEFDAPMKRTASGSGSFVDFPYDVLELYGVKNRVPIAATFDGIPYRGSMVKMGSGCHMVLILKEIRERLGKDKGDIVHVTVALDDQPRVVQVPADVTSAFRANPAAKTAYDKLAYTHQREYIKGVEEAKRVETRERRIVQMMERLDSH